MEEQIKRRQDYFPYNTYFEKDCCDFYCTFAPLRVNFFPEECAPRFTMDCEFC